MQLSQRERTGSNGLGAGLKLSQTALHMHACLVTGDEAVGIGTQRPPTHSTRSDVLGRMERTNERDV